MRAPLATGASEKDSVGIDTLSCLLWGQARYSSAVGDGGGLEGCGVVLACVCLVIRDSVWHLCLSLLNRRVQSSSWAHSGASLAPPRRCIFPPPVCLQAHGFLLPALKCPCVAPTVSVALSLLFSLIFPSSVPSYCFQVCGEKIELSQNEGWG